MSGSVLKIPKPNVPNWRYQKSRFLLQLFVINQPESFPHMHDGQNCQNTFTNFILPK